MQHAPVTSVTVQPENMQAVARERDITRVRTMSTIDLPDGATPPIDDRVREQIGRALCLQNLLQQITPENSHEEVFEDRPVGNEEW